MQFCCAERALNGVDDTAALTQEFDSRLHHNFDDFLHVFVPRAREVDPSAIVSNASCWRDHWWLVYAIADNCWLLWVVSPAAGRQPILGLLWNSDNLLSVQFQLRVAKETSG